MRVAVTGATGFIGRQLTVDLVGRAMEVRAVVRPDSTNAVAGAVAVVRAPLEAGTLREAFSDVDVVVHLAGIVTALDQATYPKVNVEGTRAVASAAAAAGARLIYISSLAAAGSAPANAPRSEDDAPSPRTPYGHSKLEGERIVRAMAGLRWTILRPGVVYGPGDRAVLPLFKSADRGILPLVGRAGAAYTFIHVHDVVRTIAAAITGPVDGATLFVGHPRPATARDILDAVRLAVGRPAVIVPIPMALTRLGAWAGDLAGRLAGRPMPLNHWRYAELSAEGFVCRVDRLREQLGIVAEFDLHDGFAQTATWYRQAGWIRPAEAGRYR